MVFNNYLEKNSDITTLPNIDCYGSSQINEEDSYHSPTNIPGYWEHFEITLSKHPTFGFGIAISGGCDDPHFYSRDSSIFISDVVRKGPACGLLQLNDIIASVNGISFNNIDYISAINTIKNATQLRMIIKRRVPLPLIELEQRTLKFSLSKSRKKDDFGIVLGCKYYIKEITNPKLAEKNPGLKEGDIVLQINGQLLDDISIDEATKMLQKSKEKLSLVVQRDVKRGTPGSRWPSQNTVYERLGSVVGTPRHSPSPMMTNYYVPSDGTDINSHISKRPSSSNSTSTKKLSDDPSSYNGGGSLYIPSQYCNNIKKDSIMTNSLGIGNSVQSNCSSPSINIVSQFSNGKESSRRLVVFKKAGNNLGIRVIGGNQAGIWISAIQEGSPAAMHGVKVGDKIISVNNFPMGGLTREEAVNYLLNLNEEVHAQLEFLPHEFEHIRINQLGDSFYIRTHFEHNKKNDKNELTFDNGDIFHVSDTLYGGSIGCWQVSRIYSANEDDKKDRVGIIPNATTAEILLKQQKMETNTFAKSLFRKKLSIKKSKYLQGKDNNDNGQQTSDGLILPAYEKVSLRRPPFKRPIILYGPLADIARQLLLTNYSYCFAGIEEDKQIRLSNIDALINQSKHSLLNVSPESVEKLSYAQYAPIVILIDVETRSRVKELRQKAGGVHINSRKLIDQANKIKKNYGYLLSATLDATKEDGWFEALRQLIIHLQDRSVWMPEHKPSQGIEELVLNGWHDIESEEVDSIKGGDYGNMGEYTNYNIYGGNEILDRESRLKNNEYINRRDITPVSAYRTQTESYLAPVIGPRKIHNATSYHEKYTTNKLPGTYDINQVLQDTFGDQVYRRSPYNNINDGREQLLKQYDSRNYPRSPTNRISSNTTKQIVNNVDITHHHTKDTSTDKSSSSSEVSAINSKKNTEPTIIEHISSVIDVNGGKLVCPDSGVELVIPPGAIPSDHHQEIYIKICKDTLNNAIPINLEKEKLLSPLVMCGPLGLKFLKPVELRFPKTFDGSDQKGGSIKTTQNNCFVLKSSCGEEWKNLEVSKENTNIENINQNYVAVSVMNF